MYCQKCGTQLAHGLNFCFNCGIKIINTIKNDLQVINKKNSTDFVDVNHTQPANANNTYSEGMIAAIACLALFVLVLLVALPSLLKKAYSTKDNTSGLIENQAVVNNDQQDEIEKLKLDFSNLNKNTQTIKNNQTQNKLVGPVSKEIVASEIAPYLSGVVQVGCFVGSVEISGSGSLWNFAGLKNTVLSNNNVAGEGNCFITAQKETSDKFGSGIYNLGKDRVAWNNLADASVLKITTTLVDNSTPSGNLNYSISTLPQCASEMAIGSPVVVIGYPAFSHNDVVVGDVSGGLSFRTLTNGVISAHDTSVTYSGLPYPNYFVSAKIDSGNSGGIAISKNITGLCLLGIPTWLSVGNYDTSGLVQNIHNVFYEK